MDAPHISTLDTQEDATPPPLASKDSSTTFILEQPQAAHAHPQTPQQTKPLRVVRDPMQPHREVYVLEDDEEDQLIDDDDEVGGPSRAAAAAALAPSTSVIRDMVGPSVPAPSPRPPPANSLPEHMLPSNHPPSGPVSTSDRPSPSPRKRNAKPKKLVDEANAPIGIPVIFPVAKKKRVRTAIKATLEVVRQEPETHDNTGTTSAWRLDTPNPIVQDEVKPPVKRRRGPRNSGQGTVSAPPQPVAPAAAPPPRKRIR
ncbi:hypothetical protein FRB99_001209 [Tulasnella sp. 403]|nr:hypothetical protein FRB99_001209 [Tulasnella sp. 403]